jgi:hypothetical protein
MRTRQRPLFFQGNDMLVLTTYHNELPVFSYVLLRGWSSFVDLELFYSGSGYELQKVPGPDPNLAPERTRYKS